MGWEDDFDKEEDTREDVPDGTYEFAVVNAKLDETRDPARVSIECEIMGGEHDGRKVWANHQLANHGHFFLKKTLTALGIKEPKAKNMLSDLDSLIGLKCQGSTKQRTYKDRNGQDRVAINLNINHLIDKNAPALDSKEDVPF